MRLGLRQEIPRVACAACLLAAFWLVLSAPLAASGLPATEAGAEASSTRSGNLLLNGDFESTEFVGLAPWGGFVHANGERYSFVKGSGFARSGSNGVEIRQLQPEEWGALSQNVQTQRDAPGEFRLRAALRGIGVVDSALLQVVMRQPGRQPRVFTKELPAAMFENDWIDAELTFDIPAGAAELTVMVVLNGAGALWVDDVELVPFIERPMIDPEQVERRRSQRSAGAEALP